MKRILMLSLVVGMILTITSQAFAMMEFPEIIADRLSPKYRYFEQTQPLL